MGKIPEINCDLGEGISNEEEIFPWIDIASVACGGHFGDRSTITDTIELAKKFNKKVGAHPSYPDQENFGRKSISISIETLLESINEQISLFLSVSNDLKVSMNHIKFHGALYNDASKNQNLADALTDFLFDEYPNTPIFTPPNSQMESFALKKGIPIMREIFADRAYHSDYSLVSRTVAGSLLSNLDSILNHLSSLFSFGYLRSIEGEKLALQADTICFHGDNPGLLDFLPELRKKWWG